MISAENTKKVLNFFMKKHHYNECKIAVADGSISGMKARSYMWFFTTDFNNEVKVVCYSNGIICYSNGIFGNRLDMPEDAKIEDIIEKMFELSRSGYEVYVSSARLCAVDVLLKPFETLEEVLVKADLEDLEEEKDG